MDWGSIDWLTVAQWFSLGCLMAAIWVQVMTGRQHRQRAEKREFLAGSWSKKRHDQITSDRTMLYHEVITALESVDNAVAKLRAEGGCPGCAEDAVTRGLRFERIRAKTKMREWGTDPFSQPTVWEEP